MREYIKNKNFIPYSVFRKKIDKNSRSETNIIIIFVLINLFLVSINIKENNKANEVMNSSLIEDNLCVNKNYSKDNLIKTCDTLFDEKIINAYITNLEGNINIKELATIKDIENNEDFSVNDIEYDEENKIYKVSLNIHE